LRTTAKQALKERAAIIAGSWFASGIKYQGTS
jgi:hypothetical protein